MTALRVCVIGGGPAGLFAARLLAIDHPDWEISVYERLPPRDTFGFGVGLTDGTLRTLQAADPDVHRSIVEAAYPFAGAEFRMPGGIARLVRFHSGAIRRSRLLALLQEHAERSGVDVHIGEEMDLDQALDAADLVVGADGVSSATRARFAAELGARETLGRGLFIWCGAELDLDRTVFAPARTEHGLFVAHCYPYAEHQATFVIETDAQAVARAGCVTATFSADGDSDEPALDYLSHAFAELLQGGRFVGNRSRWSHFRTVTCQRWHHERVVLLGDAKATAHPSIGSGTKLALEDAVALARSLRDVESHDLVAKLADFERVRRPAVDRLQDRARRSQLWWESFDARAQLSPARLAVAYLSRAGAVSLDDLRTSAPELARQAVSDFSGVDQGSVPDRELAQWVLERPLVSNGASLPTRILDVEQASAGALSPRTLAVECDDPWGNEAASVVATAKALVDDGCGLICLSGAASRAALLDRLALAERVRRAAGVPVAVEGSGSQIDDLADALVAGRADLATLSTLTSKITRKR
jgi:anthraniloyl-CoA monooxygenase